MMCLLWEEITNKLYQQQPGIAVGLVFAVATVVAMVSNKALKEVDMCISKQGSGVVLLPKSTIPCWLGKAGR
jgi:hypothetical protein